MLIMMIKTMTMIKIKKMGGLQDTKIMELTFKTSAKPMCIKHIARKIK